MLCWLHPSISIGTIHFWHVFHKAIIESRLTSWIKALKMVTRQALKDTIYYWHEEIENTFPFSLCNILSVCFSVVNKNEKTIQSNTARTPDFNEWGYTLIPDDCLTTALQLHLKIHFSMLTNMERLTKYHKVTSITHLD